MRAVVIEKPGEVGVTDVPEPTPGTGEVVVRVGACGVCGTDLHIVDGDFPPAPYPLVPGHEFAGEVVATGPGVAHVAEGSRVAVDPSLFCGYCDRCRAGRGNLCENWGATGDTVDGAFAEYVRVPAANCHLLPDGMTFRQGAAVEPLSCAVHAVRMLAPQVGDRALVVGAGTMGLLTAQLLARSGAGVVHVVDRNPARLPLADELGATATATDVLQARDAQPAGFDLVVDATGVPAAMEAALDACARGARYLVLGVAPEDARISVSPFRVYNDELTILGSMAVLHSFPQAVRLVADGLVEVEPLLTHALGLDEFGRALDLVRAGEGVKVQVVPDGRG